MLVITEVHQNQSASKNENEIRNQGMDVEKPDVDDICTGVDILIKIQKTRIRWSTL